MFEPRETVGKPEDPPEIAREKTAEWQIEVPEDLAISHPLVKQAAAAIRTLSRDIAKNRVVRWQDRYQAKLVKPGAGHLDIAVSKASLPRASRIMQALLAAFDRRGFAIRVTEKNETFVTVLDESVSDRIGRALQAGDGQAHLRHRRRSGAVRSADAENRLELSQRRSFRQSAAHD